VRVFFLEKKRLYQATSQCHHPAREGEKKRGFLISFTFIRVKVGINKRVSRLWGLKTKRESPRQFAENDMGKAGMAGPKL